MGPRIAGRRSSGDIVIRAAAPADADRIAEIYNEGIRERQATFETQLRERADVRRWLEDGERFPVLVAATGNRVCGWARVTSYSPREAYRGVGECQVYVDPAVRGRGMGRRLLDAICRQAEECGYWKLIGRLFAGNEASTALVRAGGFREVGVHVRHGRLDGEWRDVLVVERLLGAAAQSGRAGTRNAPGRGQTTAHVRRTDLRADGHPAGDDVRRVQKAAHAAPAPVAGGSPEAAGHAASRWVNAREEAFERLDGAYEARVLEPSPPAVAEDPWFADDPVARGEPTPGRHVVSPVGTGDLRWDDLAKDDPDLAEFCAERWLGAFRRLQPLPETFAGTRTRLHEVAENVLAPARQRENGKIGLRFTRHGFGTPFFGDDLQLRVEGQWLVTQTRDGAERDRIEGVDERAALALGAWFGFAASVLEEIRAEASAEDSPGRVQIWPEHFDASVDLGDEAAGLRAGCGASPGDEEHPEPYLYVQPWTARPTGELWQATGFTGAELPYSALLAADDQREAALDFIRTRLRALADNSTKEQP